MNSISVFFNFRRMKKYSLYLLFIALSCNKSEIPGELVLGDEVFDTGLVINDKNFKKPCLDGYAGNYPCLGYDLLAQISLREFGSNSANDNWGWKDPETEKEYVLLGLDDGTAFIDISDPENPIFLGKLPTASTTSPWRDVKVFKNHAFIVSEAQNHGLQVFDLTKLRSVKNFEIFDASAILEDFGNAHNIWINEASSFAYVMGSNLYAGGPVFIDISDPKNPKILGGYSRERYTHDAHVVNYTGPDPEFQGKEIFFGSNSDGGENNRIVILDVTDKLNPSKISTIDYSGPGYTHQGFLTEDHRYFFLGDELDELQFGLKTQTRIFDFSSLKEPKLHFKYFSNFDAIDHNGYIVGEHFFLANYSAGLRVIDISEVQNKTIFEKGFFDTYPSDNNPKFNGVWSIYPFFESGVIAISDIDSGLFLVNASANDE